MKNGLFLGFVVLVLQSCAYFETKKISSEDVYNQELKTINWNDIDTYPVFKSCETNPENQDLKLCFEKTLHTSIFETINSVSKKVRVDINDTILVHLSISKEAKLKITQVEIDSLLQTQLPKLEGLIYQAIDSLQPIAPAYKRGIPVKTSFTLPIVVVTD